MKKTRNESDSFGNLAVPSDKFWGAQTQRSLKNFDIGQEKHNLSLIYGLITIKQAAAVVNMKHGMLTKKLGNAIIRACKEILSGKFDDNFPLSVWQTGSGTQTNMNANEVIANVAIKILNGKVGSKNPIHPNDHVNMSQSSNDTFPTAIHIATVKTCLDKTLPGMKILLSKLRIKEKEFQNIIKIGRTHTQDATPLTLGQEFSGYCFQIQKGIERISKSLADVHFLAQGGTAVGTGINAPKAFSKEVATEISRITQIRFRSAPNKFEALSANDPIVELSGSLKTVAASLFKIANDMRFLGSGPRCGLGELALPENEPGSSIMPGKVNPTQAEAVTMVCTQVMGNDAAIGIAGSQGHFELNVFKPVIAHNILQSLELIGDASASFANNCIVGIKANKEQISKHLENSLMLVTALAPKIGYDNATKIAKDAHSKGTTLRIEAISSGLVDENEFNKLVDPKKMI
ncbi:MAG: class II fumarate hydratase [Rhodospirillales bacterium]|nr:class II fumarate hydratase [Rhodospirillales bacterium]